MRVGKSIINNRDAISTSIPSIRSACFLHYYARRLVYLEEYTIWMNKINIAFLSLQMNPWKECSLHFGLRSNMSGAPA